MRKRRLLTMLIMAAAIACTMTACGFGDKEDDSQIVVETEVTPTPEAEPTPTIAPNVQTTTYTSANKICQPLKDYCAMFCIFSYLGRFSRVFFMHYFHYSIHSP